MEGYVGLPAAGRRPGGVALSLLEHMRERKTHGYLTFLFTTKVACLRAYAQAGEEHEEKNRNH